jgi:hypothetical protein
MFKCVVRILALVPLCWACGGGGLGQPVAQFPTRSELEEVSQRPATPAAPQQTMTVERWSLEVVAPEFGSAYPAETPWDQHLLDYVKTAKAELAASPELRCAARETARFLAENGALPDDGLRRYMLARCGSTLPRADLASASFELPESMTDSEVEAFVKPALAKMLPVVPEGRGAIGLGFARNKGRGSFVVYRGAADVTLDAFSAIVLGEEFILSGRLHDTTVSAIALVTQGKYGFASCEPDRRVEYPRFKVSCPIPVEDAQALVEVATRRPENVLAQPVLHVLVRRTAEAGLVYDSGAYTSDGATTHGTDGPPSFRDTLLLALNQARSAAKVRAFELESRQSQLNEQVTPQFFEASYSQNEELCNLVALGVLAGWDVDGVIRGGGVYAGGEPNTRDAVRWLNTALESPLGRWTLLDDQMSKVAIGSAPLGPSGVVALVTTYSFFQSNDHSMDEDVVFEELRKQRAARDLPPPRRRQRGQDMSAALTQIATNELTSDEALQNALTRVSAGNQVRLQGWVAETSDLSMVPTAEALLGAGNLDVEVGVTHYKAPGGAWGQYVVLLMFTMTPLDEGRRANLDAPGGF